MGSGTRTGRELPMAIRAMGNLGLGLEGVHVYLRDQPVVAHHWVADLRRDVFSASKTFTSAAVGIAQAEGLLDTADPVLAHLGHLTPAPAPGMDAVTIGQLLTMTSGISYRWNDPDADHPGDPAIDILTTTLGATPGTAFAYRGANTYLLSRVIHGCSGQDLRDFLLARLFLPLEIRNPQWLRCPLGFSLGAVGLQLRTAELATLGRVLLDGGRFLDRQLMPADFLASMTADWVPTGAHVATGAATPHPDNALRPPRLDLFPGRRLANGRHLRAVQHRAASPPGMRDGHRPLPRAHHRHSGRHLVPHRARAQVIGGRPALVGDGYVLLVVRSPLCSDHRFRPQEALMRIARLTRSTKVAVVVGLGIATVISNAVVPASAATLAITSLDCQPRRGAFLCTGSVSGGTSPYTYLWNQGALKTSTSSSTTSTAIVSCPAGSTAVRTIGFAVTDSDGATASQSTQIDCSETWWRP